MNRKDFLSCIVPLATIGYGFSGNSSILSTKNERRIPPYLQKGDTIAITCPSGFIELKDCMAAIKTMDEWGLKIRLGKTVGARDFSFAGSDEERIADFQTLIDDEEVKAIMFGRGGYGSVRIIDRIDFSHFQKKPKWIIGFSDATVFHAHIFQNFGIATIHSKMCNSFPSEIMAEDDVRYKSIESIRRCLFGEHLSYECLPNTNNRKGNAEGILVGGNLSVLVNLCGSQSDIDTDDKILFIEDVGEYLYKIDSMIMHLKRSGKLKKLKGLIIGSFQIKPDDPGEEFGRTIYEIVSEKIKEFDYPICFDFPVGHVKENYALMHGATYQLSINEVKVMLKNLNA